MAEPFKKDLREVPVAEWKAPSARAVPRGRFATNMAANLGNLILGLAVGLFFTPYLVKCLGPSLYGLVPLTNTMVSYMSIATLGLNTAVSRYLTVALEKGETSEANRIFNTSLFGSLWITLALLIPATLLACFAHVVVKVPAGAEDSVRVLFAFTAAAFLLSTAATAFGVSTFCRNRFDLSYLIAAMGTLIRVGVVVALFQVFTPGLWQVGWGILGASVIAAAAAVWTWRKLTPELGIAPRLADFDTFKSISQTTGWLLISQVGTLLLVSVDLLVANRMLGPEAAGRYAVVLQWSILLRGVAGGFSGLFAPTVMSLFARGEIDALVRYARRSVKFIGLLLALPVGLVCGFSGPLLRLWVGEGFVSLSPLMMLLTLPLCVNLAYLPLHHLSLATDKVRLPGIVQLAIGLANIMLAVLLSSHVVGWGAYGIALSGIAVLTFRNLVFTPFYGAYILGRCGPIFMREAVPCVVSSLSVVAACLAVRQVWDFRSWFDLILGAGLISIVYATAGFWLFLSREERSELLSRLPRSLGFG